MRHSNTTFYMLWYIDMQELLLMFIVFTAKLMFVLAFYGLYDKLVIRNPRFWAVVRATNNLVADVRYNFTCTMVKFWDGIYTVQERLEGKKYVSAIKYFDFK